MTTEELMKLADAYAAAYMSFSESKARAALEAALSAKQGEQDAVEPKCVVIVEVFGKDWRLEYMSLPVGRHKLYPQQFTYTHPAPSVNAQEANNDEVICPKCVHQFRAIPMNVQERISELEAENFNLAAGHCIIDGAKGLTADEGGTPYCAMEKKVERLEEAVDMAVYNLSMFNQTNNNQFFDEAFDALRKVYPK